MIVGLIGAKRTGKTTCAEYLINNYKFESIAFADPIKQACKIIFDFDEEQLEGKYKETVDERWGITPRQAFQIMGTDFFRQFLPENHKEFEKVVGNKMWIKRLMIWCEKNKEKNIVISDIRFPNEAEEVKKMGGILIKITNPKVNINKDSHISEQLIDKIDYDYLINNNSDINSYYLQIDVLFNKIMEKMKKKLN